MDTPFCIRWENVRSTNKKGKKKKTERFTRSIDGDNVPISFLSFFWVVIIIIIIGVGTKLIIKVLHSCANTFTEIPFGWLTFCFSLANDFFFLFPSAWVLINHQHVPQSFYELCRILFAVMFIVKYIYELVMKFFFSFSGFPSYSSIHPYYTDGSGGGASTAERPASALHQVRRRSLPGLRTPLLAVSLF